MSNTFTHIDKNNNPCMVDVSQKIESTRTAVAEAFIKIPDIIISKLENGDIKSKKGPVFHTAIIAGTMAVKKTHELIPFCHPLIIESCKFKITPIINESRIHIECQVKISGKTGVEMEALTGVSTACLTIYDMCKAFSQEMIISDITLIKKTGGKSDIDKAAIC
jgi:cyclic pyranopterin phosphate synthase